MSGAYAAMFTPITKDNRINEEAIEQMVEYAAQALKRVAALVIIKRSRG